MITDLRTAKEVRDAYGRIRNRVPSARPGATLKGVLVEGFAEGGRETIVGMTTHRGFGPILMFGPPTAVDQEAVAQSGVGGVEGR